MQNLSQTQNTSLSPGDVVGGRYVIQGRIGGGSMGEIYLALQRPFDRPIAVKVLQPWYMQDESIRRRFFLEGRVLSRLTHPNTVTVFEFGRHRDSFFIAMEYVRGQNLGELITSRGAMPPEDAVPLAIQVAQSLGEAHSQGVVHRDLKPENVLVSGRSSGAPFVKVVDFGIAKLARRDARSSAAMMGTPHFMAPEQVSGDVIDGRADLYALGCCLFEMLTGRPPFDGETTLSVIMAHANAPRPELPENLPPALSRFIQRAMAIDPNDRPADAAAFTAELIVAATQPLPSPADTAPRRRVPSSLEVETLRSSRPDGALEPEPVWIEVEPVEPVDTSPATPVALKTPHTAPNRHTWVWVGLAASAVMVALIALWVPGTQTVVFESSPRGAVVEINGATVGTTPLELNLDEGDVLRGRIVMTGYEPLSFEQSASSGRVFAPLERALIEVNITAPDAIRGATLRVNGEDLGVVGSQRTVMVEWPLEGGVRVELQDAAFETIVESLPSSALRPKLEVKVAPERLVSR